MRITLLAAVAALGFGVAPAFAADVPSSLGGYVYQGFWGDEAAQPAPAAKAPVHTNGAAIGAYVTRSSHGTWLFPPDSNGGGANS